MFIGAGGFKGARKESRVACHRRLLGLTARSRLRKGRGRSVKEARMFAIKLPPWPRESARQRFALSDFARRD